MTVRECARLQTFPDSYGFTGPIARQFTQVGNAVPPVLAYVMATAIYDSIYAPLHHPTEHKLELQPIDRVAMYLPVRVDRDSGQQLLAMEPKTGYGTRDSDKKHSPIAKARGKGIPSRVVT